MSAAAVLDQSSTISPAEFFGQSAWKIAEDNERLPEAWNPETTQLVSVIQPDHPIPGTQAIERVKEQGAKPLGWRAFLYFWQNQEKIPASWKGRVVCFDGTFIAGTLGRHYTMQLRWVNGRLEHRCDWAGHERVSAYVTACL